MQMDLKIEISYLVWEFNFLPAQSPHVTYTQASRGMGRGRRRQVKKLFFLLRFFRFVARWPPAKNSQSAVDLDQDPDPYKKNDGSGSGFWRPKTDGSHRSGSGSTTVQQTIFAVIWLYIVHYFLKVRIIFLRFYQHFLVPYLDITCR